MMKVKYTYTGTAAQTAFARPWYRRYKWAIILVAVIIVLYTVKLNVNRILPASSADIKNNPEYVGSSAGHEWVDLGLSVKWATCNVGAVTPGVYGNHYAWGETSPKSEYTSDSSLRRSNSDIGDIAGDAFYDAARANWGGVWRLPTKAELIELKDRCTWKWAKQDGHEGYKVSGPNGSSIFLPAAGYYSDASLRLVGKMGLYGSSSPAPDERYWELDFGPTQVGGQAGLRSFGMSVCPVLE